MELYTCIRNTFLSRASVTLRPLTRSGKCAWKRHPENRIRGDAGSTAAKQLSVETFGLRLDWRAPPSVVAHADPMVDDEFELVDWGTLSDGMHNAWLADVSKKNRRVQLAVSLEIPGCDVWRCDIVRSQSFL